MRSPVPLTFAGMAVLALALGIGRFLLTPLLPLMQADAGLSLVGGGWLASINNIGYLLGALLCTAWKLPQRATLRAGLLLVALGTLGMGLAPSLPLWLACRFVAGVAAAALMVHGIAWCTAHLRAHGRAGLEAVLYSGPGVGIIASGALVAALHGIPGLDSARWWLAFGAASAAATALVWRALGAPASMALASVAKGTAREAGPAWPLVAVYGLFGFAYVIPATFLPLIADAQLHLPALREWFWPLYGVATVLATLLLGALPAVRNNYAGLAGCCLSMLLGGALCLYWPSRAGLALGTVLEGAAITPVVMYAMREAARLAPHDPTRLIGALTVAFGIGQIVGPPVAAALAQRLHGFAAPLELATLAATVALAIALSRVRRARKLTSPACLAD
ncbi:YbfB/YjiJ family MFS transporter [Fulvimonas sp. R45]|uniref:YbfB/YjiJ family MFS transporter n=1 Tax=Fulvimonas sp. R45 TaxID=3045937 RepID=UPI0026603246|nr:YbfB/YjiJ family MFS transporter [Fulvimonas sp. R45]MDO1527594.1 YbfB/YjiJ family MFS transporter [Fulvimonas sp. R45]